MIKGGITPLCLRLIAEVMSVNIREKIIDAIDVETVILSESEDEAREIGLSFMKSLGFDDVDVVFVEHSGFSARIRLRTYIHRPGDRYAWLSTGGALK